MSVRPAGIDARAAIVDIAYRRPWFGAPSRAYAPEARGQRLAAALEAQIDALLDHASVDLLVHGDPVSGFALVQHEVEETVTGKTISLLRDPSWIDDPSLLDEAARRAGERGSCRLGMDLYVGDDVQAAAAAAAGLTPEYDRIVCDLEQAPPPVETPIEVRRARDEDRLFLVALSTECVPFMFCADRKDDIALVRQRFFDVYAALDLANDPDLLPLIAFVDGAPAGAILARPEAGQAADDAVEAYIYDVSVLPEHWGGRVAVAVVDRLIQEMRRRGTKYLTGDISVDNTRVQGLSQRYRFHPEYARHYRRL